MKIALYTFTNNEAFMLPFFFDHYRPQVDRIVVYENESTDGSGDIAARLGADEVRPLVTNGLRDDVQRDVRNECWKELKGQGYDWVIIPDVDEFLWHPNGLRNHLGRCLASGATVCVPQGYQMLPRKQLAYGRGSIIDQAPHGRRVGEYCKPIVFNPDAIGDMNFVPGSHRAVPFGNVVLDVAESFGLLHYHYVSLEYVMARYKAKMARMSQQNLEIGWGVHYMRKEDVVRREMHDLRRASCDARRYMVRKMGQKDNPTAAAKRRARTRPGKLNVARSRMPGRPDIDVIAKIYGPKNAAAITALHRKPRDR